MSEKTPAPMLRPLNAIMWGICRLDENGEVGFSIQDDFYGGPLEHDR